MKRQDGRVVTRSSMEREVQIGQCCKWLATAATFLQKCCVARAQGRRDEPWKLVTRFGVNKVSMMRFDKYSMLFTFHCFLGYFDTKRIIYKEMQSFESRTKELDLP